MYWVSGGFRGVPPGLRGIQGCSFLEFQGPSRGVPKGLRDIQVDFQSVSVGAWTIHEV